MHFPVDLNRRSSRNFLAENKNGYFKITHYIYKDIFKTAFAK
jgi:hypothetical protein